MDVERERKKSVWGKDLQANCIPLCWDKKKKISTQNADLLRTTKEDCLPTNDPIIILRLL